MATARPHRCGEVDDLTADEVERHLAEAAARRGPKPPPVYERQTPRLDEQQIDRCPVHGDWRYQQRCDLCTADTATQTTPDRRTMIDVAVA